MELGLHLKLGRNIELSKDPDVEVLFELEPKKDPCVELKFYWDLGKHLEAS